MPTGQAYVFFRPSGAPKPLVEYQGHVGWGFRADDGTFTMGSVENTHGGAEVPAAEKDAWVYDNITAPIPFAAATDFLKNGRPDPWSTRYDLYRVLDVPTPNAAYAREVADDDRLHQPFKGIGNNCTDYVRKVLRAYGYDIDPSILHDPRPYIFFGGLPGPQIPITVAWPGAAMDVALFSGLQDGGQRTQAVSTDPDNVVVFDDITDQDGFLYPRYHEVVSYAGYIALYSGVGFGGDSYLVKPGERVEPSQLEPFGDDGSVRSWIAAAKQFDPKSPPIQT